MGEPRVLESDGVTYVAVPDFERWAIDSEWATVANDEQRRREQAEADLQEALGLLRDALHEGIVDNFVRRSIVAFLARHRKEPPE